MNATHFDIIVQPIVTEKSMAGMERGKYTFKVAPNATKIQIRQAIERIYRVRVEKVNTLNVRGKPRRGYRQTQGRTSHWKKAIVTLASGNAIELFDRVEEQGG
jgi:large subunit ribosomal protein L23